jgi:hypothetical protein
MQPLTALLSNLKGSTRPRSKGLRSEVGDSFSTAGGNVEGVAIRIVTDRDVRGAQELKRIFPRKDELDLLAGTLDLRYGHMHNDSLTLRRGYDRVWPWVCREDRSDESARRKHFVDTYGKDNFYSERWYPQIVAEMLSKARLVVWFSGKARQFVPAIFCPDWKTAAFVKHFLGRLRSCPHCGKLFVPSRSDTDYCCTKCRDAHRLARWRANKKKNGEHP